MRKHEVYSTLVTLATMILIYLIGRSVPENVIRQLIDQAGVWGPLVITLALLITYVVAPFSNVPIIYAGYYAYGSNVVIFSVIANYISFVINFYLARTWGRTFVQRLVGDHKLEQFDNLTKNYGSFTLFLLRAFQGSIHDFVSYTAGLTEIGFKKYMVISITATLPGNIFWYYVSQYNFDATSFTFISIAITAVFSGLFLIGAYFNKRRKTTS